VAITVALPTLPILRLLTAPKCFFCFDPLKMGHSLPTMPMNQRVKFDAASFILAGEIRNRTNKKQTVNDIISTPRLSSCVDNKKKQHDYLA